MFSQLFPSPHSTHAFRFRGFCFHFCQLIYFQCFIPYFENDLFGQTIEIPSSSPSSPYLNVFHFLHNQQVSSHPSFCLEDSILFYFNTFFASSLHWKVHSLSTRIHSIFKCSTHFMRIHWKLGNFCFILPNG